MVTVLNEALQAWELEPHEFLAPALLNGSKLLALHPGRLPAIHLIGMVPLIADLDVLERRKICPFWDSYTHVPILGQLLYYQFQPIDSTFLCFFSFIQ